MSRPRVGSEDDRFKSFLESKDSAPIHPNQSGGDIPEEIRGLNWGAFGMNVVWGTAMRVHIAWLCIVPFVGMVMPFVLLIKGNEWAWRNGKWDSVEHFLSVQRNWAWATAIMFGVMFLISLTISAFLSNLIYSLWPDIPGIKEKILTFNN